jgi:hypothetical protein
VTVSLYAEFTASKEFCFFVAYYVTVRNWASRSDRPFIRDVDDLSTVNYKYTVNGSTSASSNLLQILLYMICCQK